MNGVREVLEDNRIVWICFFLLMIFSLFRTNIHIDEARYLTVAWEMGFRGDYLVPYLNGEPYSHKPPLLFWLTNFFWSATGPQLWVARLIPIFFTIGTTILLAPFTKSLFPNQPHLPALAQKAFLSSFVVLVISQLYMFDTLMTFWVTAACYLIYDYDQRKDQKIYPLLLGSVLGLGILTKGPVIFVYTLPFMVLHKLICSPKQNNLHSFRLKSWDLMLVKKAECTSVHEHFERSRKPKSSVVFCMPYLWAIIIATLMGLSWAIAAVLRGGESYAEMLLWKQTANRLINSTYHQRPWWFYGAYLPILFLPTLFLPKFLSKLPERLQQLWMDQTCRLLLLWTVTIVILFSFISCKQIQYLCPLSPIIAILMARYYGDAVVLLPQKASKNLSILVGISFCLIGALLPYWNERIEQRLPLQALSKEIKTIQKDQSRPFAFMHSRYHGEFGYLIKQSRVDHLLNFHDLNPWFTKNPTGFVMAFIPRHEYTRYKKKYGSSHNILFFQEGKGNYYMLLEKRIQME